MGKGVWLIKLGQDNDGDKGLLLSEDIVGEQRHGHGQQGSLQEKHGLMGEQGVGKDHKNTEVEFGLLLWVDRLYHSMWSSLFIKPVSFFSLCPDEITMVNSLSQPNTVNGKDGPGEQSVNCMRFFFFSFFLF